MAIAEVVNRETLSLHVGVAHVNGFVQIRCIAHHRHFEQGRGIAESELRFLI